MKKKNYMSARQSREIGDYLLEIHKEFPNHTYSAATLARDASEALQYPIPNSAIRAQANAIGMRLATRTRHPTSNQAELPFPAPTPFDDFRALTLFLGGVIPEHRWTPQFRDLLQRAKTGAIVLDQGGSK